MQPLVSKAILPWFGGCPAVWTTCMLFFQVLLFGGYVYAHLSQRFLAPRNQVLLHLTLVVAALLLMPIAPGTGWKPDRQFDLPAGRILLLLTCTVGLPYFVLSATSPLVQSWFSRTYPGRSPYRLYALSNVGSLPGAVELSVLLRVGDGPARAIVALVGGVRGLRGAVRRVLVVAAATERSRNPAAVRGRLRRRPIATTIRRPLRPRGFTALCGCCCRPARR